MNWPLTLFRAFSVIVVTLFTVAGLYRLSVVGAEGDLRDWNSFLTAGQLVVAGDAAELYRTERFPVGFQFVYPPPMAIVYAPLGMLSEDAAHYAWLGFIWVLYILSILFIIRALKPSPAFGATIALGALASGAWWSNSVVGQNGSLWLFSMALGLYLHKEGKPVQTGVALSLLLLKPSLGLGVLSVILVSRRLAIAQGMLIGGTGISALSLVLPPTLWREWFSQVLSQLGKAGDAQGKFWFQDTLLAFLRATMGDGAILPWAVTLVCTAGLIIYALRSRDTPTWYERMISIATLTIVACSPYSFTYDSVLLVVPAALWLCTFRHLLPPKTNLIIGSILWLITILHLVGPFYLKSSSLPMVGVLVWFWLVILCTTKTESKT